MTAEQYLERFIAELAEDQDLVAMVPAYDGQMAQMQALGMDFDDILRVHDGMFSAYARARDWLVLQNNTAQAPPPAPEASP